MTVDPKATGAEAWIEGLDEGVNPYDPRWAPAEREAWQAGWLEAREASGGHRGRGPKKSVPRATSAPMQNEA